ncbi:MAG: hypothetical protein IJ506_04470, partial [Clostridia bacterium]|nr:hypothetical protein [Clostridia bacterium]
FEGGQNDLVQLRFTYEPRSYYEFWARRTTMKTGTQPASAEGYMCYLQEQYSSTSGYRETFYTWAYTNSNTRKSISLDATNYTTEEGDAGTLGQFQQGDSVLVTYGVYDADATYDLNGDGTVDSSTEGEGSYVYFKVVNETRNYTKTFNKKDTVSAANDGLKQTDSTSTKNVFSVTTMTIGGETGVTGANNNPVSIQGVYAPIINDEYDLTVEESYGVGTSVSELSLPEGYALKDTSATLAVGANELAATYTLAEYNGNTNVKIDCTVTVEATAYSVTKIEDLVDSTEDFETVVSDTTLLGSGTEWSVKGSNANGTVVYASLEDDEAYQNSANAYSGNISTKSEGTAHLGTFIKNTTKDTVVQFRMTWQEQSHSFYARMNSNTGYITAYTGYRLDFKKNTNYTGATAVWIYGYKSGSTDTDSVKGGATPSNNAVCTAGDVLKITFGAYDVLEDETMKTYVRWYVYNETTSTVVYDYTIEDTSVANRTGYDSATYATEGCSQDYRYIAIQTAYGSTDAGTSVGGINAPIVNEVYNASLESTEGVAISALEIPAGYALKSTEGTLAAGENKLAATYTIAEYYGNTDVKIDCEIVVNATALERISVTVDGAEIARVIKGQAYTLPQGTASADGKVFVGYKMNGELYPAGYEIAEATADIALTTVEVTFNFTDGAGVRVVTEDAVNGVGGIRFKANLSGTEELGEFTWKGYIIPLEKLTGKSLEQGIQTASNNSTLKTVSAENMGKGYVWFTMTDLKETSYAKEFVCASYIEVTYEGGTTAKIFADYSAEEAEKYNARTIKAVATAEYQDYLDEVVEYDADQVALLKQYAGITE